MCGFRNSFWTPSTKLRPPNLNRRNLRLRPRRLLNREGEEAAADPCWRRHQGRISKKIKFKFKIPFSRFFQETLVREISIWTSFFKGLRWRHRVSQNLKRRSRSQLQQSPKRNQPNRWFNSFNSPVSLRNNSLLGWHSHSSQFKVNQHCQSNSLNLCNLPNNK